MIKFFEIVNNELVVQREELLMVKEFKLIWTRVRGMETDNDGRKKRMNTLELMYIQKMADCLMQDNIYAGFSDREKHHKVKADIGLPTGWEADTPVREAVSKWIEIQMTYSPSVHILRNIHDGLMLSGNAIQTINKQLVSLIATNNNLISNDMNVEDVVTVTENSKAIVQLIGSVLDLGKRIPNTINEITNFEKTIRKEIGEKTSPFKAGGKKVGLFENPN